MNIKDIAIVNGARTPMGRYCEKLRDFTPMELGAIAGKEAIKRAGVEATDIDHVVYGHAQQTSSDSHYGARHVGILAGIPIETPALTVNRLCGSGMQSIVSAAQMIQLGEAKTVLAGGMESMSQAPFVVRGARWGIGLGQGKLEDSLMQGLLDTQCGMYMAQTAEEYSRQQGMTRLQMDEFSLAMLCDAVADYEAARERVREKGATALSPNGYEMPSVYETRMRKAFDRLTKLLLEFGMTPASRTKVKVIEPITHGRSVRKQTNYLDGTRG